MSLADMQSPSSSLRGGYIRAAYDATPSRIDPNSVPVMIIHKMANAQNVFADLGFDADEAEDLKARSDMMVAIKHIIRERGLKQVVAAELFGTTQPRISMLLAGRIDEFTVDALWTMLHHAGIHA